MIRIVGIQRCSNPQSEFVLLQNQGGLRMHLKGHLLLGDAAYSGTDLSEVSYLFADDVIIPPGMFVLLYSGIGEARWTKTKEQQLVYNCYMDRSHAFWDRTAGALHLLNLQHTLHERREALMLS